MGLSREGGAVRRGGLVGVFVFSGAAGLVFEVALQRELSRAFGVSAFATATVLAAYMAGLSLGAWLLGARADRWSPKRAVAVYAGLEVGIALCAVVLPVVARWCVEAFSTWAQGTPHDAPGLAFGRLAMAFVVCLPPTVLMGGTLPVLAAALGPEDGAQVPKLYLGNLVGAGLGAAFGTYLLLPTLGLSGTLRFGAAANVAAAVLAVLLSRGLSVAPRSTGTVSEAGTLPRRFLAWAFWSGLCTFVAEVVWTHLLAVVVGNSAYAFGLMLSVFLAGLALGAWRVASLPVEKAERAFAIAQAAAGAGLGLSIPLWNAAPTVFVLAGPAVTSWAGREVVRALVCVELVLLPAFALGAGFPLLLRAAAARTNAGALVGRLGALNTLGAVSGSLLTGFVLLPALGSRHVLELVAVGAVLVGALGLTGRARWLALAVVPVIAVLPAWNLARLGSGANVYFRDRGYGDATLVWAAESPASGLTTVVRGGDALTVLLTNGKFQGSDGAERDAQRAIGQAPLLVAPKEGPVLHVGIGTGATLAGIAAQGFTRVDAVELSRDILEAGRRYFGAVNAGVLEPGTPGVALHVADGRNFLLLSRERYAVIGMELSSIWFAGAADLYNREFYRLAKAHLVPGGVLQQWVQLHHLTREDLAVIVATLRSELPHVALLSHGGQGILLASESPLVVDGALADGRTEALRGTEATAGLPEGNLRAMLGWVVLDEAGAEALAKEAPALSTDDNLWLEYSTPKSNVRHELDAASLLESLQQPGATLPVR